jgi:hypothetical protein
MEWLWKGFRLIGLFVTARDYTIQFTNTHTHTHTNILVPTVTSSLAAAR